MAEVAASHTDIALRSLHIGIVTGAAVIAAVLDHFLRRLCGVA
jgi:hypothetical protein